MKKLYLFLLIALSGCWTDHPSQDVGSEIVTKYEDCSKNDSIALKSDVDSTLMSYFLEVEAKEVHHNNTKQKRFTNTSDDTLSLGGASLCVPADCMAEEMTLSITKLDSAQLPKLPAGLKNVTSDGGGFRFLPHGEHFRKSAKVVLPYDSLRIPNGFTHKDIRTYFFDEKSRQWTLLPKDSIDRPKQLASALTTHFTDMINGIVTVPETPDAQGFVPTTMSGIKAADPSANMLAVSTPNANNNGNAALQIPFKFPVGRAGMNPEFSVCYSSDGSSGWCGYGWSLSVPSICVETRWGVPRYDKNTESESYLFSGEQFTERHYRDSGKQRETDKNFYLRRETDFSEIVRKGSAPNNYEWEVKRKDGSTENYKAVAQDPKGNICEWASSSKTDIHGNCVRYEYETADGTSYLKSVNYTGFGDEKGAYTIQLNRKGGRADATVSGRNGFLQKDAQLLSSIDVLYKDEVFRRYVFEYKEGQFKKTLLASVSETDGNGNVLYTNSFDYYDDFAENAGKLFSNEAVEVNTDSHFGKDWFFKSFDDDYSCVLSNIGGAKSNGFGLNTGLNAGVGFSAASIFGGASYSHNRNTGKGLICLTDIDGDGLPDRVYERNDRLYYQPNLYAKTGQISFGRECEIKGINRISETKSISNGVGADIGIGYGWLSAGCSYSYMKDVNTTKVYFQDFNGDGLIDLADDKTVFFNRIENGVPTFKSTSDGTPNPIAATPEDMMRELMYVDTVQLRDSLEKTYPLQDAVRSWRAPFSGRVKVAFSIVCSSESTDGVLCALQHNGDELGRWFPRGSKKEDYDTMVEVEAGDHLYFRTMSNYDGKNDIVSWSPTIDYVSFDDRNLANITQDENGVDIRHYSASEDFQQAASAPVSVAGSPLFKVSGSYNIQNPTEKVTLAILRTDKEDKTDTVFTKTFDAGFIGSGELSYEENITEIDTFNYTFQILNQGVICRKSVEWTPIATRQIKGVDIIDNVAPQRNQYNRVVTLVPSTRVEPDTIAYASDTVYLSTEQTPTAITIKVADSVEIPQAKHLQFLQNEIVGKNINVTFAYGADASIPKDNSVDLVRKLERITIRFDSTFVEDSLHIDTIRTVEIYDTTIAKINANVYTEFDNADFGDQYQGWGQFVYNGNGEYGKSAMDESVLHSDRTDYSEVSTEELPNLAQGNSYNSQRFHTMMYNAQGKAYWGGGENIFVSATGQGSSRLGEETIDLELPETPVGGGTSAPHLVTKTETHSFTINAGAGLKKLSLGMNYGNSKATSLSENGILDLNGDRYPDWTERDDDQSDIKYTNENGAVSNRKLSKNFRLQKQDATSTNRSLSLGYSANGEPKAMTAPKDAFKKPPVEQSNKACGIEESAYGASANGNYCNGSSTSEREWYDINGDGLPDMIIKGGTTHLNIGYDFVSADANEINSMNEYENSSWGVGLSASVPLCGKASIGTGYNYNRSTSENSLELIDLNGDGLPDWHSGDKVRINTGTGFAEEQDLWNTDNAWRNISVSNGLHVNGAMTFKIFFVSLTPFLNTTVSKSVSRTETAIIDVDGDGLPDFLSSQKDDALTYRKNMTGRTNLLKTITLPFGATVHLDYERSKNTYEMPNSKFVLKSVETIGGEPENGATRRLTGFEYEGGLYDRYEREFLGFAKVTTHQYDTENDDAIYRSVYQAFNNKNYTDKGLLMSVVATDKEGEKISETTNAYTPTKTDNGGVFQSLTQTKSAEYISGESISQTESFTYDKIGNITHYTSVAGDEVIVDITYHNDQNLQNQRIPKSVVVKGGNAQRTRSTKINPKTGDITEIRMENGENTAVYDMEYDDYGNITKLTRPKNHNGDRFWNAYTYDTEVHSFVTDIDNAYNYHSSNEFDYRFGVPTRTTDINGNTIAYEYDDFGRPTKLTSPYETDYTLKFRYDLSIKPPRQSTLQRKAISLRPRFATI